MRPILVTDAQRLAEQQRAKARAIDEQVAGYLRAVIEHQRVDESVLGTQFDVNDARIDTRNAELLGETAHMLREKRCIEVQCPIEDAELRAGIGPAAWHTPNPRERAQRIIAERRGVAQGAGLQPIMVEIHAFRSCP